MNYFSHFVFDHRENKHEFNTGLLLPDITRKYIRRFSNSLTGKNLNGKHQLFLEGCLRHYETDKKFHSSDFFNKYFTLINEEIKRIELSEGVNRSWFVSHIFFELLVDRIFVKYKVEWLDNFYESLQNVDESSLVSFLEFYGMKRMDDFLNFFNHFRSVKYIYYYTDNNKFVYSLNRIMQRVKLNGFTGTDEVKMIELLMKIERKYFSNADKMYSEIKEVLN